MRPTNNILTKFQTKINIIYNIIIDDYEIKSKIQKTEIDSIGRH